MLINFDTNQFSFFCLVIIIIKVKKHIDEQDIGEVIGRFLQAAIVTHRRGIAVIDIKNILNPKYSPRKPTLPADIGVLHKDSRLD